MFGRRARAERQAEWDAETARIRANNAAELESSWATHDARQAQEQADWWGRIARREAADGGGAARDYALKVRAQYQQDARDAEARAMNAHNRMTTTDRRR